jgi:HEAT repeats
VRHMSYGWLWAAAVVAVILVATAPQPGAQSGIPYETPPKFNDAPPVVTVPQNTKPLSPEELQRAEALLPLLDGSKQEFWAIGEFVHLGEPSIPILVKALSMPGPRARYNAIETLSMLNAASAVPALLTTAKDPNEIPRVREHALRVAIRLDPPKTPEAIQAMAKDQNSSIRKAAAHGSRYVREKAVVPILIDMIADDERFVAMSAIQSLWILTLHETEFHDWDASTKAERQEWMGEWTDWWNAEKDTFQIPESKRRSGGRQG